MGQLDKLGVLNHRNRGKCVITDRSDLSCSVASQVQVSPQQAAAFMLSSPSDLPTPHTQHTQLPLPVSDPILLENIQWHSTDNVSV